MKFVPTADLCDAHPDNVKIAAPMFRTYGGVTQFCGTIATVRAHEDNSKVKEMVQQPGEGRILVVDGGGSTWCALMGDRVARAAWEHGWSGVVIYGCVRDVSELSAIPIGIRAIAACPRRSRKRGEGSVGEAIRFAGIEFHPGEALFSDEDGVVVLPEPPSED